MPDLDKSKWRSENHRKWPACADERPRPDCRQQSELLHHGKSPTVTRDYLQDRKIAGLAREIARLRKSQEMLVDLVDIDEMRAALELKTIMPTHDELLKMAKKCIPPEDIPEEEKPW